MTGEPEDDSPRPSVEDFIEAYKVPILLGLGSVLCIVVSFILLVKSTQTSSPIRFSGESDEASPGGQQYQSISVDIEGAVKSPGVFSMPVGSRVEDAIAASGGLTGDADANFIAKSLNRAQKLVDGMKLYIPREGEGQTSQNLDTLSRRGDASYNVSVIYNDGGIAGQTFVSVNNASQSELEFLPGIGPVTASKIISNRPYTSLDELVARKVIGTALFEKLKNSLTL